MKTYIKVLLSTLFLFVSILAMSSVYAMSDANLTIVTPVTTSTLTINIPINCSFNLGGTLENYTTARLYMRSRSGTTGNSTWTPIKTEGGLALANTTSYDFVSVFNTTSLEDYIDYQLNCSVHNGTRYLSKVTSNLIVGNTVPTAPTSLDPVSNEVNKSSTRNIDFSATVVNRETTNCTLFFPNLNPGLSSYKMTNTAGSCTYQVSAMPEQSYDYYIQASDGTDTTNSATTRFTVRSDSNPAVVMSLGEEPSFVLEDKPTAMSIVDRVVSGIKGEKGGAPVWFWIALIVATIIVYFKFIKK